MGPHRRPELLLWGAGVFMLLFLQPTTSSPSSNDCSSKEFYSLERDRCFECQLCFKNASQTLDGQFHEVCQKNNPDPVPVAYLPKTDVYLWCSSESKRVRHARKAAIDRARSNAATVPETTITTQPTTLNSSTLPEVIPGSTRVGQVEHNPSGMNGNMVLVTIPICVLLLAFAAFCLVLKLRGRRSKYSPPSTQPSTEQSTPLTKHTDIERCDVESGDVDDDMLDVESPNTSPQPNPLSIIATPRSTLNEGDQLQLDASQARDEHPVVWVNQRTGTVLIGPTIFFESIAYFQRGTYIASNGSRSDSINIIVERISRLAEENTEYPEVVKIREPVEIGPEPVEDALPLCLPATESDDVPETLAIAYQPSDARIVQTRAIEHGPSHIVPSGRPSADVNNVAQVIERLITQVDHDRTQNVQIGCTLRLVDILSDEVAMQQLAVLADTSSTWRIFAATKGNMSVDEIDFVRCNTTGTGNTVGGVFKYIIDYKNGANLTAADFSTSLRDAGWKGCDKIIYLLFKLHPHCSVCRGLQNRDGETQMVRDIKLQTDIPGFQYHLNDKHCHCIQPVRDLARLQTYSEEFRQKSAIYFCNDPYAPIWSAVGSHLGGMSTELLEHFNLHYRGPDKYLKMLDFLVQLYPQLKVGTLAEWLHDHNHSSARDILLNYHRKNHDCSYCRQFEEKAYR